MQSDDKKFSIPHSAGLAIDFVVIVVPIVLTAAIAGAITVALLPEFSLAVVCAAAILAAVRWINSRDDEYRTKRYSQVPH